MKRKLTLFLVVLMLFSIMLTACSSNGSKNTTTAASPSTTAASSTTTTASSTTTAASSAATTVSSTTTAASSSTKQEESSGPKEGQLELVTDAGTFIMNETGYPLTEEPSTFSILAATALLTFDDSIWMNQVAEYTNVYPEWICIPTAARDERKALVYASGEYPDVMGPRMVSKNDTVTYGPTGILTNVKDLLYQYATNLVEFLPSEIWAQFECYDGNIYFIPTVYSNKGGTANCFGNNYYSMPKAWLDQLSLEVPTTVDEFYDVLVALRDADCNGNGKKDEIPLAIMPLSGNPLNALEGMSCWFGRPGTYYVEDDGTVVDGRLYPEHKEAVKFLQKCYAEGLLDVELFSMDLSAFRAKGAADPATYGYVFGYQSNYMTTDEKAKEIYDIMPLLKDPNGNISFIYGNQSSCGVLYQAAVTSACQCPELVVRWANYLYTPEVTLQTNDGPFGIKFYFDDNNNLKQYNDIDNPDKIPAGYESFSSFLIATREQQIPRLYGPPLVTKYMLDNFGYDLEAINNMIGREHNYKAYDLWGPYAVQEFPQVTPSAEENEKLNQYNTDMNKLYNETLTAWIIGNADIDAEWDSFVEQMNAFGAQEVLAIKQSQSDQYFAKLKG